MPTLPDNTDKFIDQACHAVFAQCDGGRMGKEVSVVFLKRLTYTSVQCAGALLHKVDHIRTYVYENPASEAVCFANKLHGEE